VARDTDTVFWKTKEWWADNCHLGATQLSDKFGGPAPTWSHRLKTARQIDKRDRWGLAWALITRGSNPISPPDEAVTPPRCDNCTMTVTERVEKDREVRRLGERVRDAEAKYNEAIRGGEVEDRIIATMERKVPLLAPVQSPAPTPRQGARSEETVVALISDYHIGEVVSAEETGGLAHYDFDTFMRRFTYHIDSIGGICFGKLTGYKLPRLHIAMLGDMISGIIHEELVETAEGTIMEWVIDGAHVIAQGIRQLASEFESVQIDCVVGNHGRMSKQIRFKQRYVNWDYLCYHFIRLELADQHNVTFNIPKSFYMLSQVEGHGMLLLHGDNIKSWNGVPWYGINRAVTNLSALLHAQKRTFDIVNLGHFHNAGTLDRIDSELILNGSAVGGNEFSIGALFASNQPRQVLYGVHPDRGRTWQYALDLSHGDDKESRYTV